MTRHVLNRPNVARQWEADRAKGYTFATSVADLIDNSIGEGQASRIHLQFEIQPGGELSFMLADNGIGMTKEKLFTAMTEGSESSTPKHELSKFGFGMKTASWAHARRLVVVSRPRGDEDNPSAAAWDGDHIVEVGEWEMEEIDDIPRVYLEYLDALDGKVSGTVVIWEKVDRLLHNYKDGEGKARKKGLSAELEKVREHLGLVFHRFLDKDFSGAPNIEIFINEKPVLPWDPFAERFGNYEQPSNKQKLTEEARRPIVVTPYLLPREDAWQYKEEYRKTVKRDNELQGFYLYRANRLLQLPSWLGLGKQEPHANLARVKIDINSDWDEVLHVDVKKASVVFPQNFRDELSKVKQFISNLADLQRRQGGGAPVPSGDSHDAGNEAIGRQKGRVPRPKVESVAEDGSSATVVNTSGTLPGVRVVTPQPGLPGNIVVNPQGLQDGQLWGAVVTSSKDAGTDTALELSGLHEFYRRVYIPASTSHHAKLAMDMLLWALAQAELNQASPATRALFEDFRYEIARTLRLLAEELPAVEEDDD